LSEQANFISLLKQSLLALVRLPGEFGLINLVVEPLQALDTSHELRFRKANWGGSNHTACLPNCSF
jgi:hypothetical protein